MALRLRRIGEGLDRCAAAHRDAPRALPPDLATLVTEGPMGVGVPLVDTGRWSQCPTLKEQD